MRSILRLFDFEMKYPKLRTSFVLVYSFPGVLMHFQPLNVVGILKDGKFGEQSHGLECIGFLGMEDTAHSLKSVTKL